MSEYSNPSIFDQATEIPHEKLYVGGKTTETYATDGIHSILVEPEVPKESASKASYRSLITYAPKQTEGEYETFRIHTKNGIESNKILRLSDDIIIITETVEDDQTRTAMCDLQTGSAWYSSTLIPETEIGIPADLDILKLNNITITANQIKDNKPYYSFSSLTNLVNCLDYLGIPTGVALTHSASSR